MNHFTNKEADNKGFELRTQDPEDLEAREPRTFINYDHYKLELKRMWNRTIDQQEP